VSYWEWVKLLAGALAISIALSTVVGFTAYAGWWFTN
jgi:hypothetical protein